LGKNSLYLKKKGLGIVKASKIAVLYKGKLYYVK